ncbi:MAG: holin family protein [Pseudomonadota bacterium]
MGMIADMFSMLFGNSRNVLRETAEVFRENAEAGAQRGVQMQGQAMAQFGAEFAGIRQGGFDRFMDGLNRLPRPAMALGTLGLFVSAMVDPIWFSERMQSLALVPEPLWWLLGVVVSFYFGARHQRKTQEFQRDIAKTMARVPKVAENLGALREMRAEGIGSADTAPDAPLTLAATKPSDNPALEVWKAERATI